MSVVSGQVAIVGVGESDIGKVPGRSAMDLGAQACAEALADARLGKSEVDGLFVVPSYLDYNVRYSTAFAEYVGFDSSQMRVVETVGLGAASSSGHAIQMGAAYIAAGMCETALVVAADSFRSFGGATSAGRDKALTGMAMNRNKEFENPYGPLVAATFALAAQKYLHDFQVSEEDLAWVPITARRFALLNRRAQMRDSPLDVNDVMASPLVSDPLRKLHCSLVSDGGCAVVLRRSGTGESPEVQILAAECVYGSGSGYVHDSYSQASGIFSYRSGAEAASARAFKKSGVTVGDIDLLYTYDPFAIVPALYVEGLGYCDPGEGLELFRSGYFGPDGKVPWNTHGGLLSYCHPGFPGGLFMFVEAARQLRGTPSGFAASGAEIALVLGYGAQQGIFPCTILAGVQS